MTKRELTMLVAVALAVGCSPAPTGLARSKPAAVTVKMDFFNKPLPEIALPNDIATRYDENSPTKRRINASMIAPTAFEARTRQRLDDLDGWGVMQAITVPFTGTIDVNSVVDRHDDVDYDSRDDAIYVLYLGPDESRIGEVHHLDIGNGNYPAVLERRDLYYKNDPRGDSMTLFYEEADEDLNRNGVLDPGEDADGDGVLDEGEDLDGDGKLDPPEDTDADGILDRPNYLPGMHPSSDDLAARADAVMTFYERSSNTLIARPLVPFDDASTYAVVVTRRIFDLAGDPVGSPYPFINHVAQTDTLEPLLRHLPDGLAVGGPCIDEFDCVTGSYCLRRFDFPAGTCTTNCRDDGDCRGASSCVDLESGVCLLTCETDADCVRDAYGCREIDRRGTAGRAQVCIGS